MSNDTKYIYKTLILFVHKIIRIDVNKKTETYIWTDVC